MVVISLEKKPKKYNEVFNCNKEIPHADATPPIHATFKSIW
jgi:hypothetical protein